MESSELNNNFYVTKNKHYASNGDTNRTKKNNRVRLKAEIRDLSIESLMEQSIAEEKALKRQAPVGSDNNSKKLPIIRIPKSKTDSYKITDSQAAINNGPNNNNNNNTQYKKQQKATKNTTTVRTAIELAKNTLVSPANNKSFISKSRQDPIGIEAERNKSNDNKIKLNSKMNEIKKTTSSSSNKTTEKMKQNEIKKAPQTKEKDQKIHVAQLEEKVKDESTGVIKNILSNAKQKHIADATQLVVDFCRPSRLKEQDYQDLLSNENQEGDNNYRITADLENLSETISYDIKFLHDRSLIEQSKLRKQESEARLMKIKMAQAKLMADSPIKSTSNQEQVLSHYVSQSILQKTESTQAEQQQVLSTPKNYENSTKNTNSNNYSPEPKSNNDQQNAKSIKASPKFERAKGKSSSLSRRHRNVYQSHHEQLSESLQNMKVSGDQSTKSGYLDFVRTVVKAVVFGIYLFILLM